MVLDYLFCLVIDIMDPKDDYIWSVTTNLMTRTMHLGSYVMNSFLLEKHTLGIFIGVIGNTLDEKAINYTVYTYIGYVGTKSSMIIIWINIMRLG